MAGSPVAAGDYASGTNHILPTSGAARLRGGLSAAVSQPCAIGKQIRLVKGHDGDERQRKSRHEPERRSAEQRQQRHAAGSVNPAFS